MIRIFLFIHLSYKDILSGFNLRSVRGDLPKGLVETMVSSPLGPDRKQVISLYKKVVLEMADLES
jgi:hypothetical protein